jgi:tartrate dehydratase beta subunit/fumarate hydratase class I family protein
MEAIYRITVKDFPAFIIVDDKGNDFFDAIMARPRPRCMDSYAPGAAK